MKIIIKSLALALLSATLASPVMAQPSAGVLGAPAKSAQLSNSLEQVRSRHNNNFRNRSYRRGRRGHGGNSGFGLGAAIIGGLLLSDSDRYEHRRTHRGDWDRCNRRYRSFEWNTGMYTGYDGVRHTCPYLR